MLGELNNKKLVKRTWGMRLSGMDMCVMVLATIGGFLLVPYSDSYSVLIPYVVYHFFLFCNVFRIRRFLELWWAAIFVGGFFLVQLFWPDGFVWQLFAQSVLTIFILWYETRQSCYHGVWANRWNLNLERYLSESI